MRRLILTALLAATVLTVTAPAAPAAEATPNVARWGATLEWGGMQTSGDFIYGHHPGGGAYSLKGAWGSGTVLEARGYFVEKAGGDVYAATRWRTRRGGTAISSDWNTGGSNSTTRSDYHSYTTGYDYGARSDYPDYLATSAILLQSYPDCSQVAGVDTYQGFTFDVTANPAGSDPVSGSRMRRPPSSRTTSWTAASKPRRRR